jgi:hypothetical protein
MRPVNLSVVVVGRAFNSAARHHRGLFVGLWRPISDQAARAHASFIRYPWPPFELLYKLAAGEWGQYALTVGKYSLSKSIACIVHSLMLVLVYSAIGVVLLAARSRECDCENKSIRDDAAAGLLLAWALCGRCLAATLAAGADRGG